MSEEVLGATGPISVAVVMGVSGSGKTTIAQILARRLNWDLVEGDSFHPPANVAKMSRGAPLSDADRAPWLAALAAEIARRENKTAPAVVTCSALKRRYRARLGESSHILFVYLRGSEALIRSRLESRRGHFMPSSLLSSQFEALEEPEAEDSVLIVSIDGEPDTIVDRIVMILPDNMIERAPRLL